MKRAFRRLAISNVILSACACGRAEKHETTASSAAITVTVPSAAPSAAALSAAPQTPWFAGTWEGTFQVERHQIALDPKLGGLKAWQGDTGKTGTGAVHVTMTLTPDGVARGQATGALGSLRGDGVVEDDKLTMRWAPDDQNGEFSGTLAAARDGERLKGTLQSSSGDSLVVRSAVVSLEKKK